MAAGLPVVASDVEGARTLLDGDRGVIVPLGDAGALDAAIGRLADDEVRRGRLGAAARQGVLEEFGEDGMIARLYAVLGDAIASHG
jgi:Glycosyltransferase